MTLGSNVLRKLDEQARKQRQRELELEEKLRAKAETAQLNNQDVPKWKQWVQRHRLVLGGTDIKFDVHNQRHFLLYTMETERRLGCWTVFTALEIVP